MHPTSHERRGEGRPLRWPKFAVLLFFASVCAAKAAPVARILSRLREAPFVFHPEPLLGPALASLATMVLLVWIFLDACLDRLVPRAAIAALVLLAALPWGVRERSAEEEAAYLRGAALRVAGEIGARWARGESFHRLREAAPPGPGPYVSRWLRRPPHALRFLPPGVSLPAEAAAPGSFHVAISETGGWLSVSRLAESGGSLLRREGAVEVFRITPPSKERPNEL